MNAAAEDLLLFVIVVVALVNLCCILLFPKISRRSKIKAKCKINHHHRIVIGNCVRSRYVRTYVSIRSYDSTYID